MTVLLGTVALEPNRWRRGEAIDLAPFLDDIAAAGFDGIELWERHLSDAVLAHPLPVTIFNTYASFDDADPARRRAVASAAEAAGAIGVKFNVGNDPSAVDAYAERVESWLPPGITPLCECHAGISVAEDPALAAKLFAAAGPSVGAIVHTHESEAHLRTRFAAYGERIRHAHVNFLDEGRAPRLADRRDDLAATVALLRSLGFDGSWTIEFVEGTSTERDVPALLLAQAIEDLGVLREVLG